MVGAPTPRYRSPSPSCCPMQMTTSELRATGVLRLHEHTQMLGIALSPRERDDLAATVTDIRSPRRRARQIATTSGPRPRSGWPGSATSRSRSGRDSRSTACCPRVVLDRGLAVAGRLGGHRFGARPRGGSLPPVRAPLRPALARGLLQGYVRVDDRLTTIRGRIRFADQISRWNGQAPPIEVSYDDFTVDILETSCWKAAADRLSVLGRRSASTTRELRGSATAWPRSASVRSVVRSSPRSPGPALNEHYRSATELARLILRGTGLESASGQVIAPSFLLNMATIFERFVQRALRESLGLSVREFPENSKGPPAAPAEGPAVKLEPDLSWWDGRRCVFVGDCKYKRTDNAIEHADLYQLLAYATATDLPGGLLIYAAGEADPTDHVVRHAGKVLKVQALELAGTPTEVLGQIDDLASVVRDLVRRGAAERLVGGRAGVIAVRPSPCRRASPPGPGRQPRPQAQPRHGDALEGARSDRVPRRRGRASLVDRHRARRQAHVRRHPARGRRCADRGSLRRRPCRGRTDRLVGGHLTRTCCSKVDRSAPTP